MNCYFPLGIGHGDTLEHKLTFCDAFLACAADLAKPACPVIICGDFSVAHTDDDVESVRKHAARQAGTTQAERERIDALIRLGYHDALRLFQKGKGQYSWWPNGFRVPDRHLGRRLDYFFVNDRVKPLVAGSEILAQIEGSDHCPVRIDLNL